MVSPTAILSSPGCTTNLLSPATLLLFHRPSLPRQPFYFHRLTTPSSSPTFSFVCQAKSAQFDGSNSTGDREPEEFGEVFFGDNYDITEDHESDVEEEEEEEETESSIDLLIRFLYSIFKKLSRRAKKASRFLLPSVISPQLISFAVDGILLLATLSIVKAFLEVVCTLGSTVFSVILLLRVIWTAISYFQSSGNTFDQGGGSSFGSTQQVA